MSVRNKIVEEYYRERYDDLVKYASKRVNNYSTELAEEAVQEAFSRALKYFRSYNKEEEFERWFRKILNNTINQLKRTEKDKGVVNKNSEEEPDLSINRNLNLYKNVQERLQNCSKRDIEVLNMYFFYGFKSREIAEFMNIGHNNVRQIILRFRKSLDEDN